MLGCPKAQSERPRLLRGASLARESHAKPGLHLAQGAELGLCTPLSRGCSFIKVALKFFTPDLGAALGCSQGGQHLVLSPSCPIHPWLQSGPLPDTGVQGEPLNASETGPKEE